MKAPACALWLLIAALLPTARAEVDASVERRFAAIDADRYPVRAIALAKDGSSGSVGGGASAKEADDLALMSCQAFSRGQVCSIVRRAVRVGHVDTTSSPSREPASIAPALDFGPRAFDANEVPFMWSENRDRLLAYEKSVVPSRALAISASGAWAWKTGASLEAAKEAALVSCRRVNGHEEAQAHCFVYAEENRVVMRASDVAPTPPKTKD